MKAITLALSLITFNMYCFSQPQWKFYVAFEDGTSQKDTLWMIWDSTATINVDTFLGEGPSITDYSKFNVWIYNNNFDSTKTLALPYVYFPHHTLPDINAFNFTYPILITWDSSLFHANYLPVQSNSYINEAKIDNDFFFLDNNDIALHAYNMLLTDSAFAPPFSWGSQSHFPMSISITYDPSLTRNDFNTNNIKVYPNPTHNTLYVEGVDDAKSITIFNSQGIKLKQLHINNFKELVIPVNEFSSGIYFIKLEYSNQTTLHYSFIKE